MITWKNYLRYLVEKLYYRIQSKRYRQEMKKKGVFIHPDALIIGCRNICFGEGSVVSQKSIVAASTSLLDKPLIHAIPTGYISVGKRCSISPNAIVATYGGDIEIGDDVSLNPGVILYGHGGLHIGNKTRIAAQTIIIPANHNFDHPDIPIMEQGLTRKGIFIGNDVWLGAGDKVLDGVQIDDGAVIGAGSVVTKQIPKLAIAIGVPARVVSYRQNDKQVG